jgi:beta-glucosidase
MRPAILSMQRGRSIALGVLLAASALPAGIGSAVLPVHAAGCSAWMDTTKTPDQRAHALLAAMTQADKLAMTSAPTLYGPIGWLHFGVAGYIPSPDTALCIPDLVLNDAGQGVGDFMTGTTAFPAPISQASSWDPGAQQAFGAALGAQAWAKGVNVQLAPGIETDRVPLNGRNFEYMSEDPYLAGQTGAAVVRGIQSKNVIATVKHYVANSQEATRTTVSSDIDERTLHELYLPQYEAAVQQGGAGAVMCAYNRINGVYSCQNPQTLLTDLEQQIGFSGFVMSDWGGTHATAGSANSGLDMEMGSATYFGPALGAAVQAGQVPQSRLDDMVLRILRSMFAVGLFDHPVAQGAPAQALAAATPTDTPDQNTLSGQIAERGMVLLKNQDGVLPLPAPAKRIAVIGGPATLPDALYTYNGGGSGHIPEAGYKPNVIPPLTGMQALAATKSDVITFANGNAPQFADAVAAAAAADVAVVFVYDQETEGTDRPSLSLPPEGTSCLLLTGCTAGQGYNQDGLVSAVAAANPNTVVVLETSGPVLMPWLSNVKGVVEAWYPGQDEGDAIAAVLFGDVNPSGKLPQTFPSRAADLPQLSNPALFPGVSRPGDTAGPHTAYTEGLDVGYRWFDDHGITPMFPFGHGLSYTTFGYSNLQVASATSADGVAQVAFDVTNSGKVAGSEVAQLYVGAPALNYAGEPLRQLRGYSRVTLDPGQTRHVVLQVNTRAVSYWDVTNHGWKVESGCHPVLVGSSSRDIRLQAPGIDGSMQACAAAAVVPAAPPSATVALANTSSSAVPTLPAALAATGLLTVWTLRRRRMRRASARASRGE